MSKWKFKNSALYMLFFANVVYAVKNGFSWLFWIAFALTAAALILDILEVIKNGRK